MQILPDRGPWRNRWNALLCAVCAAGIVLSGWSLHGSWQKWQDRRGSRAAIEAGCDGLVDPAAVLGLNGGTDRVEPAWRGHRLELGRVPGTCGFDRVRETDGRTERSGHFSLTVHPLPQQGPPYLHEIGVDDAPFGERHFRTDEDATARVDHAGRTPLGDGRLGDHGRRSVTVTARCEAPAATSPTSVLVTAAGAYEEEPTDADLRALARMARGAAADAARRLGCRAALPELAARLTKPSLDLGRAEEGRGTCGWYASLLQGGADRRRLPDRSAGAPTAVASRGESCVLAMSPDGVRRSFPQLSRDERGDDDLGDVLMSRPWWIHTQSYFGDDAEATVIGARGAQDDARPVILRGAGRDGHVLYASAVCSGRPAVFTMDIAPGYDRALGGRTAELFKAYAAEAAARRGCTGLGLPQ